MTTTRQPDLSDLWRSMSSTEGPPATAVHALCYVQQAAGPILTVITHQSVNVSELLAQISSAQRNAAT